MCRATCEEDQGGADDPGYKKQDYSTKGGRHVVSISQRTRVTARMR
ncbi:MAG: hypothetical protein ABL982_02515 [Vicinamibacterales bacterium]